MKKILAAIAALATAGWASAQSSVTLFGVVDAGASYQPAASLDAATGLSSKQSKWSLANSGYNSSRIGFRGTEDLGGGLATSTNGNAGRSVGGRFGWANGPVDIAVFLGSGVSYTGLPRSSTGYDIGIRHAF